MSHIRYYQEPELQDPVVIVAFGGWNDAADSATTAVKFLQNRWEPEKIAEIDSEDFYVFTETRPTVKFVDGVQRTVGWPTNQFFAHRDPVLHRDVILFIGVEPQLKWKTFCKDFVEVCAHFHVSEAVLLGALLADIPHSITVPITGTGSDTDVMERLQEMEIHTSRYEGPTGILGALHDACRRAHITTATFWAAAPHYLAATPNIKVTAALLSYLNRFLSLDLNLSDIQSDAAQFEEQVSALVARDPEASEYVRRLEERIASGIELDEDDEDDEDDFAPYLEHDHAYERTPGTGPLPSADSLIRDVEELLRKQRENKPSDASDDDNEETE